MPDFKILITGGLGYLGGRIADSLKRNHPELTIILGTSRKISESPNWAKAFPIVQLNTLDSDSIEKAVSNDIHAIIHLAALNEHDSFNNVKSISIPTFCEGKHISSKLVINPPDEMS